MFRRLRSFFRRFRRETLVGPDSGEAPIDPHPQGAFKRVPLELIYLIADRLNEVSVRCLALTCRFYYLGLSRRFSSLPLSKKRAEEFLQLLERDIPDAYVCFTCTQLHFWSYRPYALGGGRIHHNGKASNRGKSCYLLDHRISVARDKSYLPFYHARLVMNHHLYGPSHGVPLDYLNNKIHYNSLRDGIRHRWIGFARIVENELLVLRVLNLYQETRPSAEDLRRYIDQQAIEVCEHVGTDPTHHYKIPELVPPAPGQPTFMACENSLGSCPQCWTDYCITVAWCGEEIGWHIRVFVYHQLGECRTPYSLKWLNTTLRYGIRRQRSGFAGPGTVRYRWNGGYRRAFDLPGDFVGSPEYQIRTRKLDPRKCPYYPYWRQFEEAMIPMK